MKITIFHRKLFWNTPIIITSLAKCDVINSSKQIILKLLIFMYSLYIVNILSVFLWGILFWATLYIYIYITYIYSLCTLAELLFCIIRIFFQLHVISYFRLEFPSDLLRLCIDTATVCFYMSSLTVHFFETLTYVTNHSVVSSVADERSFLGLFIEFFGWTVYGIMVSACRALCIGACWCSEDVQCTELRCVWVHWWYYYYYYYYYYLGCCIAPAVNS